MRRDPRDAVRRGRFGRVEKLGDAANRFTHEWHDRTATSLDPSRRPGPPRGHLDDRASRGCGKVSNGMEAAHGVSLVICCFNSAERLPETLQHVARQVVPAHIVWEVVVVDNASTDRTAEVARQQWPKTGCDAPFRVVEQPVPGLSAARDKGLEEAAFEFVLYCDDDNWLGPDYVRHVYELMAGNPRIGAVGGHGHAVSDGQLPTWFLRYGRYYAVGHQGDESGDITDAKGYLYGAGFAVRRSVLLHVKRLGFVSRLSGRKGRVLSSGDDLEISYLIRLAGYRLWFDKRLEFVHFMPAGRLHWTYFLNMVEGTHRSRPYVDAFQRTLRGEAGGAASWHWLTESLRTVLRLIGRPKTLAMAMLGREGSAASFAVRRSKGELAGWLTVRSDHAAFARELRSLRERLPGQDGGPLEGGGARAR